ncbi:MAG: hypothetical protein ACRDT4_26605, partial [Micromonosporaceae bacterium]
GSPGVPPGQVYGSGRKRKRRWPRYAAAALILIAALAAGYLYWPKSTGSPPGAKDNPATTEPTLPDLLYNGEQPTVRTRAGKAIELPDTGRVNTVVAVPGGLVVTRSMNGTTTAQYVLGDDGTAKLTSEGASRVHVNTRGTMAAVFAGDTVTIWELKTGTKGASTKLPQGSTPNGWLKDTVLIRTGDGRHDYWDPEQGDYRARAAAAELEPLGGRAADKLLVGVTKQGCLALFDPADSFGVVKGSCQTGLTLTKERDQKLPLVSPDGTHLLALRDSVPAVANVDRLLAREGEPRLLDVDGEVTGVAWGRQVVYVMTGTDSPTYLRCGLTTGSCVKATPPGPGDGQDPARPVVRFGPLPDVG